MPTLGAFLRALGKPYTYDVRRNSYLWLGVLWGMLVPSFVYAFQMTLLEPGASGPWGVLHAHPILWAMLLQPCILGILFGAMGSVRHDLEEVNEHLIKTLRELAMTDPLTGLYNRRYVKEVLKTMLETARRTRQSAFVILLDLDGFKAINDVKGHVHGDQVLCEAARALKSTLRKSDILGRHGGDEFILIGISDRASAMLLLQRAATAVRSKTGLEQSAGIACWPEDAETPDELIGQADRLLGVAKKNSHGSRIAPRVGSPPADERGDSCVRRSLETGRREDGDSQP